MFLNFHLVWCWFCFYPPKLSLAAQRRAVLLWAGWASLRTLASSLGMRDVTQPPTHFQPQFGKEALWRETVTLSCLWAWTGKTKGAQYWSERRKLSQLLWMFAPWRAPPCLFPAAFTGPLPSLWGGQHAGGQEGAWGWQRGPGAGLWPLTPPGLQREELGTGEGMSMAGRRLILSYNMSSSWGLGRKAQLWGGSQHEYTAILYNSTHNTCCESPPQAARGQAWNTWEPQGGCSHFL